MKKYIATCYGSIIEEGGNPERCEFVIIANDREEAEDLCKSEVVSILNDNMFIEHVEIEYDGIMAHRTDGTKEWYADFDAEEMQKDVIERIINDSLKDYGEGIQKFMETVREVYNMDNTNHIMKKCFGA